MVATTTTTTTCSTVVVVGVAEEEVVGTRGDTTVPSRATETGGVVEECNTCSKELTMATKDKGNLPLVSVSIL